jgi:hypothetical protein
MYLDIRKCETCPGIILLNVYSDDGLGATSSDQLWDNFMMDLSPNLMWKKRNPTIFLVAESRKISRQEK